MSIFGIILLSLAICLIIFLLVIFKFGHLKCESNVCLIGKVALVTGGSSGIGYQIVLQLASRGCKVIIVDRTINDDIKKSIIKETHNPNIILEYADFTSFKSVRDVVEKIKSSEEKLDILINNVGIGKAPEHPSEDGVNMTMQINHYSPFLLTHLLVGLLRKSSDGRIVFTSSVASFVHTTTIDSVTENEIKLSKYRMNDYTCGKLCTVIASDIFAEKLKKYNITCNTYHPGVARSNFFNNCYVNLNHFSLTDWWSYAIIVFLRIFVGVSPRQASQPAIMLAVSEEFKNVTGIFHGKYFPDLKPLGAHNKNFCKKIWDVSEKIVKLSSEEKI
ncbi:retinol dehydrogenase 13-like [Diabrotica undecimpunctata]|uniref:retinol dehydrogenase 13-like n=1 Tax=Diabrotica undecimpunctata TaxID=50387 RepID=UPI003B631CBD